MKRAFDQFFLEVKDKNVVAIYMYGSDRCSEYSACLQQKGAVEKMSATGEAKELPNIVLRKRFGGRKIIFNKAEGGFFQFNIFYWSVFPPGVGSEGGYYVSRVNVIDTIKELEAYRM